jgi:putative membrane protein
MRALNWIWRGFLFFVLFAFALNNKEDVKVHWFFGYFWEGPLVFVVLVTFAAGCGAGVLAMVPSWWRHRRDARKRMQLIGEKSVPAKAEKPADQRDNPTTLPAPLPFPPDMVAPRKNGK